jgi:hypothetical protein
MLLIGIAITGYGIAKTVSYESSGWTYSNYWGGGVFAPFVVMMGVFLVLVSPFAISDSATSGKGRPGRRVTFPHEDVKRPWSR